MTMPTNVADTKAAFNAIVDQPLLVSEPRTPPVR
jgi:hypothetical protein